MPTRPRLYNSSEVFDTTKLGDTKSMVTQKMEGDDECDSKSMWNKIFKGLDECDNPHYPKTMDEFCDDSDRNIEV